jgi:hypothetical protein
VPAPSGCCPRLAEPGVKLQRHALEDFAESLAGGDGAPAEQGDQGVRHGLVARRGPSSERVYARHVLPRRPAATRLAALLLLAGVAAIVGALMAIAAGVTATSASAAVWRPATTNRVISPAVATWQLTTLAESGQNNGTDIPLDVESGGTFVLAGSALATLFADRHNRRLDDTRNWARRAVDALDQAGRYKKMGINELGPAALGAREAELTGLASNLTRLRKEFALLPTRRTFAHPIAGPEQDARLGETVDDNLGQVSSAAEELATWIKEAARWKELVPISGLTPIQRAALEEALYNSMEGRGELAAAAETAGRAIDEYARQVLHLRDQALQKTGTPSLTSKRAAAFILAPALVIGGVIGFAWPAPGHPTTWTDTRTWLCFAAATIGVTIAIILDGQLRELEGL